jgi:hypothetical protein
MKNYQKFLEELDYSDVDPYGEEQWRNFEDIPLFLSEDQPKVYRNGSPLQSPWTGKNLVLFEKEGKYYILGEIRYTPREYFMFYAYTEEIERKRLQEYHGEILRELNIKEKQLVIDIITKSIRFTRNLMDPANGTSYIEILNELI